jgi:enterochelin esterase family protein
MEKRQMSRPCAAFPVLVLLAAGCGSTTTPSSTSSGVGSGDTGSSGGGATAGVSIGSGIGAGGSSGASGGATAGSGVSGGSGSTTVATNSGSTDAGASGSAASGNASGSASGEAGEGGTPTGDASAACNGVQADPGTMGDGTEMLNPPYVVPPEAVGPINDPPQGTLTPPALYASKTVYPGIKFQYSIYVPAQYQKGKPAALMVILDGRLWITEAATATTFAWVDRGGWNANVVFDNLIHSGDMPVTIAVFIDPGTQSGEYTNSANDQAVRGTQYNPADDKYSQFTLTEFLPDVILSNYDIVQDPDGWCAVGHSSGGSCVFNMAMLHPDKFHKALTFSASFPNTNGVYPNKINTTPALPLRFHLQSSTNDLGGFLAANTQAAADLNAKGYLYRFVIGTSPHLPSPADVQEFPDALRWMWRGYTLPCYP